MFDPNLSAATKNHRLLHQMKKLANVTRKIVGQNDMHGLGTETADLLAVRPVEPVEEDVDEQGDILWALSQRWDLKRYNVDPEI